MFPYLDLAGFSRRAAMAAGEIAYVEQDSPGFTAARIAVRSSYINGRLRKRYGNSGKTSSLPLGQTPPLLVAAGSTPPGVSLTGRPVLGSMQISLTITTSGARGTARFSWSSDGVTTTTNVLTAATVVLGMTGLTAAFPDEIYAVDNVYAAATPVPEIVLGWLTVLVTYDLYRKRGVNPADPMMTLLVDDMTQVGAEIKEAADSKDGLFDLPASEDKDSAVTTGGPLGYSEQSPWRWTTLQAQAGRREDDGRFGCD